MVYKKKKKQQKKMSTETKNINILINSGNSNVSVNTDAHLAQNTNYTSSNNPINATGGNGTGGKATLHQ